MDQIGDVQWFLVLEPVLPLAGYYKNVSLSPGSGSLAGDKYTIKKEPVLSGTLT